MREEEIQLRPSSSLSRFLNVKSKDTIWCRTADEEGGPAFVKYKIKE